MNILFVHQNMPAQFKHVAPALAAIPGNRVAFLTRNCRMALPGVRAVTYDAPRGTGAKVHAYLRRFEDAVLHGQQVVRAILKLKKSGFKPDLVIGHSGWGETLFIKDVLPDVPLILFAELSYRGRGLDVGFDPEEACDIDTICRTRARNAHLLTSLEACDAAVSPTHWQKDSHPQALRDKISVIFDGIDLDIVKPRPDAVFRLPDGRALRRGDPVVTYVARNLEPYRGFRTFMRALPEIQRLRPDADVVVIGGDGVSYGRAPDGFPNWRAAMEAEVIFDRARVHFMGRQSYDDYLNALAVSAAHIYLTYPFVLSWSCVEAMAMGALVIASDTGPVREVIRAGENGLLTDFFNAKLLARKVADALERPQRHAPLRAAAIRTVEEHYALSRNLPEWLALVDRVAGRQGRRPALVRMRA